MNHNDFWINAERDSSGKWKSLKSGKELTFTNWTTNFPSTNSDHNYIAVHIFSGRWVNMPKTDTRYVICERFL